MNFEILEKCLNSAGTNEPDIDTWLMNYDPHVPLGTLPYDHKKKRLKEISDIVKNSNNNLEVIAFNKNELTCLNLSKWNLIPINSLVFNRRKFRKLTIENLLYENPS